VYLAWWPEDAYNLILPVYLQSVVQEGTPYQHELHQQLGLAKNFQEIVSQLPISNL
jgi:hypothetical protein